MITLADARESYYTHSGKASDVLRQLAVAGIGVIWVFKADAQGVMAIPAPLLLPALLLVAGLFLDLLQYVLAALVWGSFARIHERKGVHADDPVHAPPSLNWPALVCYYGKVLLILSAYAGIGVYLRGVVARG
ncbi:MAG TPA: hypothetical protein VEX86_15935 [Longimicrobium sp.]|nr:hypothetical protein [Longimicrobium sp.]